MYMRSVETSIHDTAYEETETIYPPFLKEHFPGIKYALGYGSSIFPIQQTGTVAAHIPNSPSRLVDFLFVISDQKLPEIEKIIVGGNEDRAWDIIEPSLRCAAQWHAANRQRHPSHYSLFLKRLDPLEIAHFQKDCRSPIMYFPLICAPPAGTQSRPLWCKYGVISESDLLKDLLTWNPFCLAGRLHKPFITFEWDRDKQSTNSSCHIPPTSLNQALHINRLNAMKAALLLLPEKFTFGSLLYTILSLSYIGDIRNRFAEDKKKVSKLLQSQLLPLSDIYLNLLTEPMGFLNTFPQIETSKPTLSTLSSCQIQPESFIFSEYQHTEGTGSLLDIIGLPSTLCDTMNSHVLSSDTFLQLKQMNKELSERARNRFTESYGNFDRVSPLTRQMREIHSALLSESFIFQQNISPNARDQIFATIPEYLQVTATAASATMRFYKLISPMTLLTKKNLQTPLGKPLRSDAISVQAGLKYMNRQASWITAQRALKTGGYLRSARYLFHKMIKRFRK